MKNEMIEFKEFAKNGGDAVGVLQDIWITIEDNGVQIGRNFRPESPIEYFHPGENIGIRYNENENDFEIRYIKNSYFSQDMKEILVVLYSNSELENMYKDYLESQFYKKYDDNGTIMYSPVETFSYDELKENGMDMNGELEFYVKSFFKWKETELIK